MPDPITRLNAALEGRYRIESELGEGGMATVYLADDLKHERKVALKVLKPELAAVVGADRFLAEIKTTANLQHPHILPLFDSGEADSFLFYVMPWVEGETLRDRLDREHQLPVDEAVRIASDVAEALGYAHSHGVIHRDIKPANILLQAGKPIIADFGIALAVGTAGQGRLTETGLSVGTPHYMSPEQATGDQHVGPATDIYALGCVLYEMLIGEPPHTGSTAQAVLGKIITEPPPRITTNRSTVPDNVEATVNTALEKVPADRFGSALDFADALGDAHFRHGEVAAAGAPRGLWNRLSVGLTVVTILLTVALVVGTFRPLARPTPEVLRFTEPIAQDVDVILGGRRGAQDGRPSSTSLALSPDGDLLVYAARDAASTPEAESRLYRRKLDQARAEPISGTQGASSPFFSPDGAWIGFIVGSSLKRISVVDGTIETIVQEGPFRLEDRQPFGATWSDDETIVFGGYGSLYQVAASGGEPELLAKPESAPGERRLYAQPHMLPGGEVLLFHLMRSFDPEQAEIVAMDLATRIEKTLLTDAMDPLYVRTGHLLFMRKGTLMAVGFDPERLEVRGQPVIIAEDVMHALFMNNTGWETGAGQVAVSASGHLAYARGGVYPEAPFIPVRVTSTGDTVPLGMDRRTYGTFRVSPDGDRLAFYAGPGQRDDIYVRDLVRGVTQRLNPGGFHNSRPSWSPDGRWLAFTSSLGGAVGNLYRLAADGSGEPERLARSDSPQHMSSWSSQGVIAFVEDGDIWVLPPDGRPAPFFTSEAAEGWATFSPDGQWVAYGSNESGRDEIYVRPYQGPEPATRISPSGGRDPAWSPDGRRLYYAQPVENPDRHVLMVVDVTPGDQFQAGRPEPLIDPWTFLQRPVRGYDVFPDGSFVTRVADDGRSRMRLFGATEFQIILNWTEELMRRVPN